MIKHNNSEATNLQIKLMIESTTLCLPFLQVPVLEVGF